MKTYPTSQIRSLALAGHSGAGKTSVAEAVARLTGLNNRLGSVTDGSSLMDFDPEEKERVGSLSTSLLACEYDGYKIHIADTPGDMDFIHDGHPAIQALEATCLVISAVDGLEVGTEKMNAVAARLERPRLIVINKMDNERANHEAVLAEVKEILGVEPVLLQVPIGDGEAFKGVVDLVTGKAYSYDGDVGQGKEGSVPADLADAVEEAAMLLAETVAMSDEDLMESFLETDSLDESQMINGLRAGISDGSLVPVVLTSAGKNIGVDRLLWSLRIFPAAGERDSFTATVPDETDVVELKADENSPFTALCFKTLIDPFVGHLSVLRVISGSATAGDTPSNPRAGKDERFGALLHLVGKKSSTADKVVPGDVFAVAKLKHTNTGDTLCHGKRPASVHWNPLPSPMISYVVKPRSRSDEDKVRTALDRVLAEDPGLKQSFDAVTKEIVVSGMGVNHITVATEKMNRKYGVEVDLGTPTIPYQESLKGKAEVRYRHKKQTGGAGQFGEVWIRVERGEPGCGLEFVDAIRGGSIPNTLIPSVEKGVRSTMERGILAGFPVVDVRVELFDGKYHPVDSKDIAFQIAGRQAMKKAGEEAGMALLEPIYEVEVVVPEVNTGDIMGDMNQRRARILSMEGRGRSSVVMAHVPLAEMLNYAPSLKSITGGKGSYSMTYHQHQAVPGNMQDKLVKDVNRLQGGDDD